LQTAADDDENPAPGREAARAGFLKPLTAVTIECAAPRPTELSQREKKL
jgi:hypothetical protein